MQILRGQQVLTAGILLGLLAAGGSAYAEDLPTYQMDEIVVTADKANAAVAETNVNVKYVSPGKTATIPDLLRDTAGIEVRARSVYGDSQNDTVKVRGLDARRYTVLLDGRQLNMSGVMGGDHIDWSSIPLDNVDRIQIVKGGKLASSNNIGGTINIITKKDATGGSVSLLAGQDGRYEYRVGYGFKAGKLHTRVDASKSGIDAYLRNNDYDARQYGLDVSYAFSGADSLSLGYHKTQADRGYVLANKKGTPHYDSSYPESVGDGGVQPSAGSITNNYGPGSYWNKDTDHYTASYTHNFKNGYLQFDYYRNHEDRKEILKSWSGVTGLDRYLTSDKSDYFGLKGATTLNAKHTLGYGAELHRLRYGYGGYNVKPLGAGDIYPSQKIDETGLYVEDNWKLDNRWGAYLGLRYDHYKADKDDDRAANMTEENKDGLSPKFSLNLTSDAQNSTNLSINRIWRSPSMPEYYWWAMNMSGNRANALEPEHGMSYELSQTHKFSDKFTTRVGGFYQDISDYINFRHVYPFKCYNIDNATILGLEWENSFKLDDHNSLQLNYTNLHTSKTGVRGGDVNNGLTDELDYSPRHKLGLSYLYDSKLWHVRYDINYVSDQQESDAMTGGAVRHIGGYAVHNLAVTRTLNKNADLSLFLDNIFAKEYVEQYGYPMAGRLFSAAVTFKF